MTSSTKEKKPLPNYYLTLDIVPGSSQNEIHHAYKRAKMTYSNGSLAAYSLLEEENNTKVLEEIEAAYAVLNSPSHRREYDLKMGFSTWVDEGDEELRRSMNRPSIPSGALDALSEDDTLADPFADISYDGAAHKAKSDSGSKKMHVRVVSNDERDEMHFEANPEFEQKIRECEVLDGAFLRAVRIYKQISLDQLAARTKLSASRIQAIEEEDLDSNYLQPVYLRGHVAIICRLLGMDRAEELAKSYMDRARAEGKLPKSGF
jgi:hypothetical protein